MALKNTDNAEWKFTDKQIEIAQGIIVERKMNALSLKEAWTMCQESFEDYWGDAPTMDIVEEYESMTCNRIEEL